MWLFTKFGFFSVVQVKEVRGAVAVRARVREDLVAFSQEYLKIGKPVQVDLGTDYPYRIYLKQGQFAEAMKKVSEDIDYTNFKDKVQEVQGHSRAELYLGIWQMMYNAEKKLKALDDGEEALKKFQQSLKR